MEKYIDRSGNIGPNCIILQPEHREPNKHRGLTPQLRFFFCHYSRWLNKSLALPGKSKVVALDLATNAL